MKLDYIELIASESLENFLSTLVIEVFPSYTTVNPAYAKKLDDMKSALENYVNDKTLERPFLYLILGPPGAGKSYLIKRLTDHLSAKQAPSSTAKLTFQAANISEMLEPGELHQLYQNIKANNESGSFTITLLDEFDVKWGDGSAIKYLINPIYDGKFWNGKKFEEFGKCAFFFAGSYLQNRDVLMRTQKLLAGVDLSKFLLDFYIDRRRANDARGMQEIKDIQDFCQVHQKWRADVDPHTDTILYLRGLDKIRDFLSRVAGNVFEIIDVSWPLSVTQEEFVIGDGPDVRPSAKLNPREVVGFIKRLEEQEQTFICYESTNAPVLEYKNVLLCERLLRVVDFLNKRFKTQFIEKGYSDFAVDRRLLNFLTVAPLINGMRSLEQLVGKINNPVESRIDYQRFKAKEIAMIVYDSQKFADPAQIWETLRDENVKLSNLTAGQTNGYVGIPLRK